jgi:hypothetical protein
MAKKKLPPDVLDYFKKEGRRGGKKAAASLTPEERSARAKKAALALPPAERSERARKAVAAREAKRRRQAKP